MQNGPDFADILALLKAANQAGKTNTQTSQAVKPWQADQSGQFRPDQASVVTELQEFLAKGLTQSLGAYLRASFETTSVSVTQMTFREALGASAGLYSLSLRLQESTVVIQIELSLVFPLIDLLLGGSGQGRTENREVTEIETHVMEGIGKIICYEIATAWGSNTGGCEVMGVQGVTHLQRLLSPTDRVVIFQFEGKMAETTGDVRLLMPGTDFNVLLRKLADDAGPIKSSKNNSLNTRLREKVLDCLFPVSLSMPDIRLPLDRLLAISPGQVCDLGVPVSRPAALIIAGRDTFDASPVRQGRKRAAHLGKQRMAVAERKA